ncbi:cyclic nucleotide-binding domain-containing protein [Tahibacter amnicola]|uniref:Cyclic nucleotide-binding domain-containing protein n=1 Tax=Tahibacter amnicola TaxID=2976241 RepID=A0ABY6BPJ4_9GAMM|nr:cyclic nucleotide-binding domain-containing protein [Tahibacter amnicola]UXI70330.1 cyclic nucleotide-binding domain-containing protein [Tahibacter amnicola]
MSERFRIAIVGSGPGGLSAAARAAERGESHVLLEAEAHLSNTIFRYQKGKFVMDEPGILPLRSPVPFKAGSRESILDAWDAAAAKLKINVRHGHEVSVIKKRDDGVFEISCTNGQRFQAQFVVLGIGLQGNIRKLGVPGEDLPIVQYQLDDPDEYEGETIVIVGAGDAAIENAVALSRQNHVVIVNRRDEFARAKKGNETAILKAIEDGIIECYYNAAPERVDALNVGRKKGRMALTTPAGKAQILIDRVIARLGATAPRGFVEACGVTFPSKDPASVPAISPQYESNVKGLYIVGALGGYPLIKQAMNQGFEVIEYIRGEKVEPADEPLLKAKFAAMPGFRSVDEALARVQANVRLLSHITPLQLREFMLDSEIRTPRAGEELFRRNDYTNSFYSVVDGEVQIVVDPVANQRVTLHKGEFFGEMSLISGRRRSATVIAGANCVLVETPRRSMNRLINSVAAVKREIDQTFILRAIQSRFAPEATAAQLADIVSHATLQTFNAGDVLFNEGEIGDCLHLVRVGSLTISRIIGGKDVVLSYVPAGNYVGEMALLGDSKRSATARAAIATETVRLDGESFKTLVARLPALKLRLQQEYRQRAAANLAMQVAPEGGDIIQFLLAQGAGEATDILLIDESLCVRCDNCEKACAETHGGTSRLDREAGPTFASVHVPTSCRHCEHPHCMKDCPPDAIHRAPNGEVYIADNCIGCGNCERNCPYGVIHMASKPPKKPGLLSWLLLGLGPGPGEAPPDPKKKKEAKEKKAVKCDMCKDVKSGPACVRACPTGAAIRISPEDFAAYARSRR